ncbi:MAG: carboxylesterase family protein [Opitutae bacterium]|nr:carboxylesterase family protein [Opitutae bacterium]
MVFLLTGLLAAGPAAESPAGLGPVVTVAGGALRGAELADGGAVFRGIPFAAPPVGPLRWQPPQPVAPWSGIRDALKPGPPPAQVSFEWDRELAAAGREGCLYLDVWTPGLPPQASRPVMVWIHGGANLSLAGGWEPVYEGRPMVARGVVLVVLEYRLGVFGFMAHPGLTAESPHHSSGNYGLLDQIAGLQWVRDNIRAFGGDPGNVTVFGQSAGSWDIMALMTSPLARGLFQKAILQSGVPPPSVTRTLADSEKAGEAMAARAHAPSTDTMKFLRSLTAEQVIAAAEGLNLFTQDGWILPEPPSAAWMRRQELPVPIIIGGNASEFPAQGTLPELRQAMASWFGELAPDAWRLYGIAGEQEPPVDPVYGDVRDQWGSDLNFRIPGILHGEWHQAAGNRVWQYEFDRAIAPHPRVQHSSELAYVFGNFLRRGGMVSGEFDAADRHLSDVMLGYWTNFAKHGDPNGAGLPAWPEFEPVGRGFMRFTQAARAVADARQRGDFVPLFRRCLEKSGDLHR